MVSYIGALRDRLAYLPYLTGVLLQLHDSSSSGGIREIAGG